MPAWGSYASEATNALHHGPLQKPGRRTSRYVTRYYVLRQGELAYYDHDYSEHPKKVISLAGGQVIEFVPGEGQHFGFMLQLQGKKTHALFAKNNEESKRWIGVISEQVEVADASDAGPRESVASRSPSIQQVRPREMSDANSVSRAANKIEDIYELKEELGSGGFSVVKKGVHRKEGTEWALKLIRNSVFQKNKERTEEEVAVLASLKHPNIVELKEVVRTPRYYVIVMELLEGKELFERIVKKEKYSENDAKRVVAGILEAIRYLHSQNIVHRDLKPENIIFDKDEEEAELKLTDFGFATLYDENHKLTATCGTPEYVAPEILDEKTYDVSVDMWSMGVITYILLCGFPPFYGDTEQELFDRICTCHYKFLTPYWDKVSEDAKDLIRQMLTLDPRKRISAEDALAHPWLSDFNAASGNVSLEAAQDELKRYQATRNFRKAVLAVLAANRMRFTLTRLEQSMK